LQAVFHYSTLSLGALPVSVLSIDSNLPVEDKREFHAVDEYHYNRSSAVRWILSHLLRYKHFMASFLCASITVAVLFSSVPRLIGLAFNEILSPNADAGRLLQNALLILALNFIRGILDIVNAFSVETLGQPLRGSRARHHEG
jgi:ABC-type bacteriocin/lantibiotic exporter with double-glycine peptidase domain